MRRWDDEDHREASGHYQAVGKATLVVGAVSLSAASVCALMGTQLGFIDTPSMAVISGLLVAVGLWMANIGREA
ncbi:MAG: hypothetical protein ACI9U2_001699 [Bradymonadia bacterium]|jgi:hypothetical protein